MASSPAVLKQQAAALELKKQPEKALALYQQLLTEHGTTDDVDVALRNRVGDLHLRVGQMDEAIALFERSADEYALSGFLNNAIALCNKILRQRPGHVPTLRRLARFSAEKGMVVDAQRHYLSVAEALEKLGQHGEALKALSEFAELSPEDVHVRSVVVEQLLRAGRKPDALPHLTVLHRLHVVAGRVDEAEGVAQVAREIDEAWVPESEMEREGKRNDGSLILLDSDDDFGLLETSPMPGSAAERPTERLEGLEPTAASAQEEIDERPSGLTLDGFEATSFESPAAAVPSAEAPAESPERSELPEAMANEETIEFLDIEPDATATPAQVDLAAIDLEDFDVPAVSPSAEADAAHAKAGTNGVASGSGDLPVFDDDFEADVAHQARSVGAHHAARPDFITPVLSTFDMGETAAPDVDLPPIDEPVVPAVAAATAPRPSRPTPTYVNLADILRDDEPTSSRMTIGEPQQSGDEEADFQNILSEFRDGIERTIPADDAESHFDLGTAFREMGLLDDAIAEFQIAARSRLKRLESIEALGGCFLDKGDAAIARTLLQRALDEPAGTHGDDTLRGVLYLMGRANEELGAREDGLRYYQRVYAVDIRFRDVAARIQTLQQPA
ncbi:MAG TPA: tetratricopeptide repeat protein [Gemmatimonadaceae bacterium]|nr:tetratricopeptide repeat protein [Gemmatimonadaceae bacterium]